ncbi:hypothetical protein [Rhizobium rhizogenes]|uniref:hypothetical protein n=1 Tax=Rhizobium rhizogenes TaxID=359 RepID=UPI001574295E|nr:hypothetical protein [Rhizobium rhizogenes]NTG07111.1 hypothetical protein [Rhizobium rhizogenes]
MVESKEIDWGGNAFPAEGGSDSGLHPDSGMSLRDWFAGQALIGLIPAYQAAYGSPTAECMEIVREAYGYADIMIATRKGGAS